MTLDEWNALVNDAIATPEDSAKLVSVMTQARDAYADLFSRFTALEADKNSLAEENNKLKQTNMDLFLRIGSELNRDTESSNTQVETNRAETITISELLNEVKEEK